LQYIGDLDTIFGNNVATGQYAKSSNEPLGIEGCEENDGGHKGAGTTNEETGITSSSSRPSKKAKIVDSDIDCLVGAFDHASEKLATAIKGAATTDKDMPEGLFETVDNLLGFEHIHKSLYYAHLVDNPHIAAAFISLPFDPKIIWVTKFVTDKFGGGGQYQWTAPQSSFMLSFLANLAAYGTKTSSGFKKIYLNACA
ncbi:hypothetical protein BAE44_0020856, partial [Dichanthelium oligosanthes]